MTDLAKLQSSLRLYAEKHVPLGGFLEAVIANDLWGAVGRADRESLAHLRQVVEYVWNELPSACCGSRERYRAWIEEVRP